jgi:ELWxxDGT repeat protein
MKQKLLLAITLIAFLSSNAQVVKVKEINNSGTLSSLPANLFTFNNKIYFAADDSNGSNSPAAADLGKELWITDGSETGTLFVKDIRTGSNGSTPQNFFSFNSKLYFTAFSTSSELWTSDGTEAGTTLVDIMPTITGESPQRFVELNGLAYFTVGGQPGSGSETTNKLVEWDGTNPAVQVADIGPGFESIFTDMVVFKDKIFMYMNYSTDDDTVDNELYSYDPSIGTFTLIKDINIGTGNSSISNFTVIGTELYFEAENVLWKTDGTNAGTIAVNTASAIDAVFNFYTWNGVLYFKGDDGTKDQLWKYDPIADTVTKLSNFTTDHNPSDFASLGSYLYYSASPENSTDSYVFRTNGIIIEQVDASIKYIDDIVVLNGKLYFEGDNGTTGNELYMLDPATLSINKVSKNTLMVYPNPISNYINISSEYLNSDFKIYSLLGQIVKKGKISSSKIIVSDLSKGNYILKINKDSKTETKKIIIK